MPQGMLDRNGATSLNLLAKKGQHLNILVENQGRINFGAQINGNRKVRRQQVVNDITLTDCYVQKGIISEVTLGGTNLTGWDHYPLNFSKLFPELSYHRLTFG
jgi:beta-galactosidase